MGSMNWPNVIHELQRRRGLTQPQIAALVGCSQASISDLSTGKTREPRFYIGRALLDLLAERPASPIPSREAA